MKLDDARKRIFLDELRGHGVVARAARRASPDSITGAVTSFRDARASDGEFAAAWDAALEDARAEVEYELHRRAVEGWDEPIYGGRYRERVVGTVRRYSDRLLELRVKGLMPEYREGARLSLSNMVAVTGDDEMRGRVLRALDGLSFEALCELADTIVRGVELLGGRPPMSLADPGDASPQVAMFEFLLGAALPRHHERASEESALCYQP